MIDILTTALGIFFLLLAMDIGRNEDSKIEWRSTDFWWQNLLLLVGVLIIKFL